MIPDQADGHQAPGFPLVVLRPSPPANKHIIMHGSSSSWSRTLEAIVSGQVVEIPSDEVFMQTLRGAQVAARGEAELPDRLRMLLFLVNGRRRMDEYRDLLPRYRNLDDAFDMLQKKGYIEPMGEPADH